MFLPFGYPYNGFLSYLRILLEDAKSVHNDGWKPKISIIIQDGGLICTESLRTQMLQGVEAYRLDYRGDTLVCYMWTQRCAQQYQLRYCPWQYSCRTYTNERAYLISPIQGPRYRTTTTFLRNHTVCLVNTHRKSGYELFVSCNYFSISYRYTVVLLVQPRTGFSLNRALFRKNVGPLPDCLQTQRCHHRHCKHPCCRRFYCYCSVVWHS